MNMNGYFTSEQVDQMKRYSERLGTEALNDAQREWPELIRQVRAAMERQAAPDSPEVRALALRWKELTALFTGGDEELTRSAERFYRDHPDKALQSGIDRELYMYISGAMKLL